MDGKYTMAWKLDGRSHPAVTFPIMKKKIETIKCWKTQSKGMRQAEPSSQINIFEFGCRP